MRASQMSSTFKRSLDDLYATQVLGERAPYHRQGREYDYEQEVKDMVSRLQEEHLFTPTPGRFHPGFQGFVKENHIKNAACLKGSLLVYANKLEWGRESALLEDASDWLEDIGFNEEDVITSSDDATSSDGDFTQSDSDSESDVDSDVDSVDDAEYDKCSSDDEDDAS